MNSAASALAVAPRVLIVAPTASGKSIMIALMVTRATTKNSSCRVLVLCHQGHLLTQNESKILEMQPDADTGVYCANEGRKETGHQVVLASRDSLGRNPHCAGIFDLVFIDEAHALSLTCGAEEDNSHYSMIMKAQPTARVVGVTATPWRADKGKIYGDEYFFKSIAYEIKMLDLIEQGFLCRPVFPDSQKKVIDTSDLKVQKSGDFKEKDLEQVSSTDVVINECLDVWQAEAADRKVTLFFCCSRAHARKTEALIRERMDDPVLYIDGDLTGKDRVTALEMVKNGYYKAIVNIGVLTTGFDAPIIDCIVFLRATASAPLFVQMGGRGLRIMEGKVNCLMLDMAGNFERFNSIEDPFVEEMTKGALPAGEELDEEGEGVKYLDKEPNTKECPMCLKFVASGFKVCVCGHVFITHKSKAYTNGPVIMEVMRFDVQHTKTRSGEECAIATYHIDMFTSHSEYLMINRDAAWAEKAKSKYRQLLSRTWAPKLIKVTPSKNHKYPNIDIIKWDVVISTDDCQHIRIDTHYDPAGQRKMVCMDCDIFMN